MKKKIIAMAVAATMCIGVLWACSKDEQMSLADKWNAAESKSMSESTEEEKLRLTGKVVAEDTVYRVYDNGVLEIMGEYSLDEEDMPEEIVKKIMSYDFNKVYITGENLRYFPVLPEKSYDIYIDETVKTISSEVFKENEQITKLVVYGDDVAVEATSFYGCSNLEIVKLQGKIAYIGDEAFSGCSKLKSVYISDDTGDIGSRCFGDCIKLEYIKLPKGLEKISYYMFYGCESLKKMEVPKKVEIIDGYAFYGCINLQNILLPEALTNIESCAFKYCCSLENIEIPKMVTEMGDGAFEGCASLSKVTIDNSLSEYAEEMYFGEYAEVVYYK